MTASLQIVAILKSWEIKLIWIAENKTLKWCLSQIRYWALRIPMNKVLLLEQVSVQKKRTNMALKCLLKISEIRTQMWILKMLHLENPGRMEMVKRITSLIKMGKMWPIISSPKMTWFIQFQIKSKFLRLHHVQQQQLQQQEQQPLYSLQQQPSPLRKRELRKEKPHFPMEEPLIKILSKMSVQVTQEKILMKKCVLGMWTSNGNLSSCWKIPDGLCQRELKVFQTKALKKWLLLS